MRRLILRLLNAPALILVFMVLVSLQTSLFVYSPLDLLEPDFLLLGVLWVALRRDFVPGGILTLILAEIAEINSAAPQGLFLCTYMLLYLLTRGVIRWMALPFFSSYVLLSMTASILWKLSYWSFLTLLGAGEGQWLRMLINLFPGAAVEGLVAYWLYRFLSWFDIATYQNEKVRRAMDEEVQISEESF